MAIPALGGACPLSSVQPVSSLSSVQPSVSVQRRTQLCLETARVGRIDRHPEPVSVTPLAGTRAILDARPGRPTANIGYVTEPVRLG